MWFIKFVDFFFGKDGSYYATVPYHSHKKATILKCPVNYDIGPSFHVSKEDIIDCALLDDVDKRLKISHHPDGFIQFSGYGITSGKDEKGNIKGIGVNSWPLKNLVDGPAMAIGIAGVEEFEKCCESKSYYIIFNDMEIEGSKNISDYVLEFFYFNEEAKSFIVDYIDSNKYLFLQHPSGKILKLRVIEPEKENKLNGFMGIYVYKSKMNFGKNKTGFTISSSSGNLRRNEKGELIGDLIGCCYPEDSYRKHIKSLNYKPVKP